MQIKGLRVTFGRIVALATMLAFLPVPALAGPDTPKVSKAAIAKAVKHEAAGGRVPGKEARQGGQATATGSFFKTKAGAVVLVVMALGTGYALYSAKEDRITGSTR